MYEYTHACMGRTTNAPQVSWKTSSNESLRPDQDLNPHSKGLSGYSAIHDNNKMQKVAYTIL